MCTTVRDPIARSAVESAPLLYSLENDVPNLSDGFSDVFDKNNALRPARPTLSAESCRPSVGIELLRRVFARLVRRTLSVGKWLSQNIP